MVLSGGDEKGTPQGRPDGDVYGRGGRVVVLGEP